MPQLVPKNVPNAKIGRSVPELPLICRAAPAEGIGASHPFRAKG
jgi:hypothetical protein